MTRGRVDPILFVLLAITWGSSYVAVSIGGSTTGPVVFVLIRVAAAVTALLVAGALVRVTRPSPDRWLPIAVVGMTGVVIPFLLVTMGQRHIDAGLSSILGATTPLFGVLFAASLIPDEPLRAGKLLGLAVGFLGVAVVVAGGGHQQAAVAPGQTGPGAALLIIGAAASAAVTGIVARRWLRGVQPLVVVLGQSLVALPVIGLLALVEGVPSSIPPVALAAGLWLGLVCSTAGPILYYRLIGSIGVGRTVMVNYLVPVVGVAGGALLLGEAIGPSTAIGAALVIGGVILANVPGERWETLLLRRSTIPATAAA
jgi:drug/metabolite transporter (DMT)-like permease